MAVQQRIIGGGLLLAGIAVVLILIFLFTDRRTPSEEAYAQLRKEIYPRYVKADEAGDYIQVQKLAEEAKQVEKATAMVAVLKLADADAAKGDRDAQGLLKLIKPLSADGTDAFDKNIQGLYELDGSWYESRSHTALRLLKRCLSEAMPALLDVRRDAKTLAGVLDQLRLGSGLEIAIPDPAPVTSNPVVAADALLFRGFALTTGEVAKALATKGGSAKANSARLVWNQPDATAARARLAEALGKVPARADAIERAAVALGKAEQDLKGREDAQAQAAAYLKSAAAQLATVLEGDARKAFEGSASIPAIAEALKQDAKLLKGYAPNAPGLGKALAGGFAP